MALILAIDLGKYNSVFCGFDPQSGEAEFRTAKTTPAVLRQERTRRPVGRVVIEACGPSGWVHDLCGALGLTCDLCCGTVGRPCHNRGGPCLTNSPPPSKPTGREVFAGPVRFTAQLGSTAGLAWASPRRCP